MSIPDGHRKRVRHLDIPGHAHELTFSCYQRLPLLEHDRHKAMLSEAIDRAMLRHEFRLVGFVYMPEHVHLIVHPRRAECRVSSLLYAIKRPHSHRVKSDMADHGDPWLSGLTIRERPGKMVFRFWQEGSGYDRNLVDPDTLRAAVEYAHANPVRRGLCRNPGQWKWSSWHHYHEGSAMDPELPTVHAFP
jgi:putative transposase